MNKTEVSFRLVIVETPYNADTQDGIERNLRYLRACLHDCTRKNEAPFASHAIFTQPGVLNDRDPTERKLGIAAGLAWKNVAHATVVYTDLGISPGMAYGIQYAQDRGQPVEFRTLGDGWDIVTGDLATSRWGR